MKLTPYCAIAAVVFIVLPLVPAPTSASIALPINTASQIIEDIETSGREPTVHEIAQLRGLARDGVVRAAIWLGSELEPIAPALALEVFVDAAAVGSSEAAFRAVALMRRWPDVEWLGQWPRMSETELLALAARGGDDHAAAACRLRLNTGEAITDTEEAIAWASCAAAGGAPDDLFNEARHRLRRSADGDREVAMVLLSTAADMGHHEAMLRLAEAIVAEGRGDYFRAANLLSKVMTEGSERLKERAAPTFQVIAGMASRDALGLESDADRRINLGNRQFTATVKARSLSVRQRPGQREPIIGNLSAGQKARVLARQGAWYQIVPPGRPADQGRPAFGWVYAGCVAIDAPPGTASSSDRHIIPYGLLPCD